MQDNALSKFLGEELPEKVGKTYVETDFSKRVTHRVQDIDHDRPTEGKAFKNSADEVFEGGVG